MNHLKNLQRRLTRSADLKIGQVFNMFNKPLLEKSRKILSINHTFMPLCVGSSWNALLAMRERE
jgi:hypothetical protein